MSEDGLKDLAPPLRKRLLAAFQAFATNNDTEAIKAYDEAATRSQQQGVLLKFCIDTKMGKYSINNTNVVFHGKKDKDKGAWLTRDQIAAPGNEHSLENADLWIEDVEKDNERLHERPASATRNIKQYWYIKKTTVKEGGKREEAKLAHDCEIKDEAHYVKLKEAMQSGMDQTGATAPKKQRNSHREKRRIQRH